MGLAGNIENWVKNVSPDSDKLDKEWLGGTSLVLKWLHDGDCGVKEVMSV